MRINPAITLAVGLAERRGQFAVFLGSGVSISAGIPSGGDLFKELQRKLYDQAKIYDSNIIYDDWVKEAPKTYSEVFSSLTDSVAARRALLEPYFLNKEPTLTHNIIAEMVKEKIIKVIITTNFDQLMEKALQKIGERYSVVSDDSDFDSCEPREHSSCRIYKIHGDYQRVNVRNTFDELSDLPEKISDEMREVFSRYGLVIMGYSGSDPGVMRLLEENKSMYGRYWISRTALDDNSPIANLIAEPPNYAIISESADDFMLELKHRIEILSSSDDDNPVQTYHLVCKLLEERNHHNLTKKIRKYKADFLKKWPSFINNPIQIDFGKITVDIADALSYLLSIGWAICDFEYKEGYKLLQEVLYDLSIISPCLNGVIYGGNSEITNIPIEICLYAWGAHAIFRKNVNFVRDLFNTDVMKNYQQFQMVKLWEKKYYKTNFNPWEKISKNSLWNTVFENEIHDLVDFQAYCAQFDLLRTIKFCLLGREDELFNTYCQIADYHLLSPMITELLVTTNWDYVFAVPFIRDQLVFDKKLIDMIRKAIVIRGSNPFMRFREDDFESHLRMMGYQEEST